MDNLTISPDVLKDGTLTVKEVPDDIKNCTFSQIYIDEKLVEQVVDIAPNIENISSFYIKNEFIDTSLFSKFDNLRGFSVSRAQNMQAIDLEGLCKLPTFERLNLQVRGSQMNSVDLSPLRRSASIKNIEVEGPIESIILDGLSECPSLERLFINTVTHYQFDLTPLSGSRSLRTLFLGDLLHPMHMLGSIVKNRTPVTLPQCENLERLTVAGCADVRKLDLTPLSQCPLEYLDLHGNSLSSIDLSPLSELTTLENLQLDGNRLESIDLSPLSELTTLKNLRLEDNMLDELDLTPLMNCKEFQYLTVDAHVNIRIAEKYRSTVMDKTWPLRERLKDVQVVFY